MRITHVGVGWVIGLLVAAAFAPAAPAQGVRVSVSSSGRVFVPGQTLTGISTQTTVTVPDGGTALVGGYSGVSEGRNESGGPGWGKGGFSWGRGGRNVGYGRSVTATRVTASVRIIDLREEEYSHTG